MNPKIKKVLLWLLVAFLIYAIIVSPDRAADIVRTVWDILVQAVQSLGRFFDKLLNR
ncbi:hypothetical protein [Arsenicicoccus sp. oral taxon 190]|uniref:hypothetical protein n=1 Tax=Arsenicicoccus sp. oral taxon 190 TaxID=1658671 RepID=UPI000AFD7E9B|nr:hypothetical protein [Arsenicicoccus sp. oral taxon 190]